MKRRIIVAIPFLLLAGCDSVPPVQIAMNNLNHRYVGLDAKEFFYHYGMPAGEPVNSGGEQVYRWESAASAKAPLIDADAGDAPRKEEVHYEETETKTYHAHDGSYKETKTHISSTREETPAPAEQKYCALEIRADSEGVIRHIVMVSDTVGKVSASRCAELFATPSLL